MQVNQKRSHFRNRRPRHRVTMPSIPSPIDCPLSLVAHSGGGVSAAGKLSSHYRRISAPLVPPVSQSGGVVRKQADGPMPEKGKEPLNFIRGPQGARGGLSKSWNNGETTSPICDRLRGRHPNRNPRHQ